MKNIADMTDEEFDSTDESELIESLFNSTQNRPLGLAELTERLDSGVPHDTIIGKTYVGVNPPAIQDDMGYFLLIADWAVLIDFDYTIIDIIER